MSKPYSLQGKVWTSLQEQSYKILTEDFVHDKLFTVKVSQKSSKGNIKLKNQIAKKDKQMKSSGEIEVWFPVWETGNIYLRSKNTETKIQYDHGITKWFGYNCNLFGSLSVSKALKNPVLKIGGACIGEKWNYSDRLRVSQDANNKLVFETSHKGIFRTGKWSFNGFKIFNWSNMSLVRNAFQVGFKQNDDNEFFVRCVGDTARSLKKFDYSNVETYANQFFFNFVRKVDDNTKAAVEAEVNPKGFVGGSVAIEKKLPEKNARVKVRADSRKAVAGAYQGIIKDYGKYSLGVEVSDIGNKNNIKYGCQIDLNL